MSVKLWESTLVDNWKSSLIDSIAETGVTAIGLVSQASLSTNAVPLFNPGQLVAPGVLVIDRIDTADNQTPAKREYISFTAISGVTITGVTRALGGSVAISHGAGAVVEAVPSTVHWNDLVDFLQVEHLSDGTHGIFSHVRQFTVTGISGASGIRGDVVFFPSSNISIYAVSGASGYSHIGIAGSPQAAHLPQFNISGALTAGTGLDTMIVEDAVTLKSVSMSVLSPVSAASLVVDINKNFTSIFTNQATRLSILGGGTYASTASIGTKSLVSGNILTLDVDNAGGNTLAVLLEI